MRDWGLMLGGLLIWTLHFLGVYGVASVADLSDPSTAAVWRWIGIAFTGACLLAVAAILLHARTRPGSSSLSRQIGIGGSLISLVAIAWQSVPLFISA